ncbi:MAG: sigma-70 family RNA polymerase sigma factor [Prevotellaceae bacterium]|jgi:RNA polymerase sigma-70 factor (ECF subfamily)|nr:sigma-70 family RNA polymerase sigma factor [Prevotellaceae bacterium]
MKEKVLEKEFIEMIQNHDRIIYKIASFYTDKDTPLSDLYQEVVLNLWRGFPLFRGDSKVSTWIYRIVLNTCVSFFRKQKKKPVYVEISKDIAAEQSNNDDIKELYNLINKLGKLERALVLLYLDEKSYQEMADITGLSLSNVATKLSRIKNKLKQMSNELN